jgi:FkbM family methyltransferase
MTDNATPVLALPAELVDAADCRYGRMRFLRSDDTIGRSLALYGEWAQAEIDLVADFVRPGDHVVDVGANIGNHTVAFARQVGPGGHVTSYEPHPVNLQLLAWNVRGNSLAHVTVCATAVGRSTRPLWMDAPDLSHATNFGAISVRDTDHGGFRVDAVTLDGHLDGDVALVKLDIEGAELAALEGAAETLARTRPVVLCECNLLDESWPIVDRLRRQGYLVFFHYAPAYNPDNFRGAHENFLGDCGEACLVAVHASRDDHVERARRRPDLQELGSLDQLAAGMLRKPQYREHLEALNGAVAPGGATAARHTGGGIRPWSRVVGGLRLLAAASRRR